MKINKWKDLILAVNPVGENSFRIPKNEGHHLAGFAMIKPFFSFSSKDKREDDD